MDNPQLKARTFEAAIRLVRFLERLPNRPFYWIVQRQLLASGTSQAAQYRAACRAQSTRDFVSKMKRMEEEADESVFWLSVLLDCGVSNDLRPEATALEREFGELTAIAVSSATTARRRLKRRHHETT